MNWCSTPSSSSTDLYATTSKSRSRRTARTCWSSVENSLASHSASPLSIAAIAISKRSMAPGEAFGSIAEHPFASTKQTRKRQRFSPLATTIRSPQKIKIALSNAPYVISAHDAARAVRAVSAESEHMSHLVNRSIWSTLQNPHSPAHATQHDDYATAPPTADGHDGLQAVGTVVGALFPPHSHHRSRRKNAGLMPRRAIARSSHIRL